MPDDWQIGALLSKACLSPQPCTQACTQLAQTGREWGRQGAERVRPQWPASLQHPHVTQPQHAAETGLRGANVSPDPQPACLLGLHAVHTKLPDRQAAAGAGKAQSVFDSYLAMCGKYRTEHEGKLRPSLVPSLHSFNLYMRALLACVSCSGLLEVVMHQHA